MNRRKLVIGTALAGGAGVSVAVPEGRATTPSRMEAIGLEAAPLLAAWSKQQEHHWRESALTPVSLDVLAEIRLREDEMDPVHERLEELFIEATDIPADTLDEIGAKASLLLREISMNCSTRGELDPEMMDPDHHMAVSLCRDMIRMAAGDPSGI